MFPPWTGADESLQSGTFGAFTNYEQSPVLCILRHAADRFEQGQVVFDWQEISNASDAKFRGTNPKFFANSRPCRGVGKEPLAVDAVMDHRDPMRWKTGALCMQFPELIRDRKNAISQFECQPSEAYSPPWLLRPGVRFQTVLAVDQGAGTNPPACKNRFDSRPIPRVHNIGPEFLYCARQPRYLKSAVGILLI
jgi:hypothetical protein